MWSYHINEGAKKFRYFWYYVFLLKEKRSLIRKIFIYNWFCVLFCSHFSLTLEKSSIQFRCFYGKMWETCQWRNANSPNGWATKIPESHQRNWMAIWTDWKANWPGLKRSGRNLLLIYLAYMLIIYLYIFHSLHIYSVEKIIVALFLKKNMRLRDWEKKRQSEGEVQV